MEEENFLNTSLSDIIESDNENINDLEKINEKYIKIKNKYKNIKLKKLSIENNLRDNKNKLNSVLNKLEEKKNDIENLESEYEVINKQHDSILDKIKLYEENFEKTKINYEIQIEQLIKQLKLIENENKNKEKLITELNSNIAKSFEQNIELVDSKLKLEEELSLLKNNNKNLENSIKKNESEIEKKLLISIFIRNEEITIANKKLFEEMLENTKLKNEMDKLMHQIKKIEDKIQIFELVRIGKIEMIKTQCQLILRKNMLDESFIEIEFPNETITLEDDKIKEINPYIENEENQFSITFEVLI